MGALYVPAGVTTPAVFGVEAPLVTASPTVSAGSPVYETGSNVRTSPLIAARSAVTTAPEIVVVVHATFDNVNVVPVTAETKVPAGNFPAESITVELRIGAKYVCAVAVVTTTVFAPAAPAATVSPVTPVYEVVTVTTAPFWNPEPVRATDLVDTAVPAVAAPTIDDGLTLVRPCAPTVIAFVYVTDPPSLLVNVTLYEPVAVVEVNVNRFKVNDVEAALVTKVVQPANPGTIGVPFVALLMVTLATVVVLGSAFPELLNPVPVITSAGIV